MIPAPAQPPSVLDALSDAAGEVARWLRDYLTAVRSGRLHPFSIVERKAREATRRDPW